MNIKENCKILKLSYNSKYFRKNRLILVWEQARIYYKYPVLLFI